MSTPRCLAQDAVSWYLSHIDEFSPHAENVQLFFRDSIIAVTLSILNEAIVPKKDGKLESGGANWRDYLEGGNGSFRPLEEDPKDFNSLPPRTKARLEAFLMGVQLALPSGDSPSTVDSGTDRSGKFATNRLGEKAPSLIEQGLSGFGGAFGNTRRPSSAAMRSISVGSVNSVVKQPQISESDLVTRLELYVRTVQRAKALGQECTIAVEPMRAIKARTHAIVEAFIESVSTVQQQSAVLTRLLATMTKEVLAVAALSEDLSKLIRRMVLDYEHTTSFASLAFLSTPESAAARSLTPMILRYMKHLRCNWEGLEADCDRELMLQKTLDAEMRHTFRTVEFRSIGHLLEVCQSFRSELQRIEFPPATTAILTEEEAVQQALRDLKREIITVNGQVLPPVMSREELIQLLSQTLNSRTLATSHRRNRKARRRPRTRRGDTRAANAAPRTVPRTPSDLSEEDFSNLSSADEGNTDSSAPRRELERRRSFRLSTVDFLTKRLLLAGSRTGTGGDAYFVVRDLFGGDDVEVVPSALPLPGQTTRRDTIEIIIRLASVTIRCHGSFDVYPKSLVGTCEPLIQVHTTTQETISLQEVRAAESGHADVKNDEFGDSDADGGENTKMVVKELITEKTGWRTLSIRPALYEKIEVWNTPS